VRRRGDRRRAQDRAPAIITRDAARPGVPCGVASGDVSDDRAIVWSRTDRPARLVVEYSTTPSFSDIRRIVGPAALEETDFTARVDIWRGCRRANAFRIGRCSRISPSSDGSACRLKAVSGHRGAGAPRRAGSSGPADRDVVFAFSADSIGQGWGIDPARGGMRLYDAIAARTARRVHPPRRHDLRRPACAGRGRAGRRVDLAQRRDRGESKVAQELADYRGNHQYNLQDQHMRRFNAEVSQVVLWDDHEVRDNWYPTQRLDRDQRYRVTSVALLGRAREARLLRVSAAPHRPAGNGAHLPQLAPTDRRSRSSRSTCARTGGANSTNRQAFLHSRRTRRFSGAAGPMAGALARGVEGHLETDCVRHCRSASWCPTLAAHSKLWRTRTTVRHSAASWRSPACYGSSAIGASATSSGSRRTCIMRPRTTYSPERGRFTEFDPFWEFVAGPLHAGAFGPNELDRTFGPGGAVRGNSGGDEAEPSAERAVSVLRHRPHRPPHAGADDEAAQRQWSDLQRRVISAPLNPPA